MTKKESDLIKEYIEYNSLLWDFNEFLESKGIDAYDFFID